EPETTVDEVRDSSMKEIHDKIDAHKKHHGGKGEPPKENNNNNDECFDASSGDDTNVTNGENPNPDEPKPKPDSENPNPDEPKPKPDGENPNPDEPKPRPDGENPNPDEPNPKPDGNFDNGNGNGKQQQNQNRPTPNNQAPDDNKESTPPEKVPDESLLSNNENEPIMTKDFVHNQTHDMNENGGYDANTFNGLNGNRDEKGYYESDCIPTPDTDRNGNPSAFPPKNFGN
ncbi:MAG: hypothetical protein J6Q89_01095, partial [Clostridia bacterium]|nr:hypothetical protein [Clostridia bacterium]